MSPSVTLNYGVRWEPWFPQDSVGPRGLQLRRRADAGRNPQHGVPAGAGRPLLSRRPGVPGQDRHEDRVVEHRAARRRFVGSERRRPHVAARRLRHDRRFRDRPVLLRLALGAAVRSGTASHRRAARRSVGRGRPDQPVPGRRWAAPTTRTTPPCTRSSSRCPTTSRRRATTAGTSRFQRQVGDNMAFSATYLGNHMVNVWGDVDGNPGVIPRGRDADRPVHAQPAGRRHADVRQLLDGSARSPPGAQSAESGSRAVLRVPRLGHRCGLAGLPRPAAVVPAPVGGRGHDQRQLHRSRRARA